MIPISLSAILILSSHLRLGLPKGLFPAGVPVKILKELLPAHLSLLDLIYYVNGTNYEVPHFEAFCTPHCHPFWAQIIASGSCFQIPLACILPLMLETMFFFNHITQLGILLFYIFYSQSLEDKSAWTE